MTGRLCIAIPLFPQFTALDAIGPYEVLQRIPTFDITFVGHARGEVRADNGMLGLVIDATFDDLPVPDVIVFPGGVGTRPLQSDARVLDWVRGAHTRTAFTTSVCTGSLVLGAAGLLDGLTATTYWANYADLAACGASRRGSHSRRTTRCGPSPSGAARSWGSRPPGCDPRTHPWSPDAMATSAARPGPPRAGR